MKSDKNSIFIEGVMSKCYNMIKVYIFAEFGEKINMISEDKLLELLEAENINAFKIISEFEYRAFIWLQSESIEELIKFAKCNNINSIFYDYIYYYKEDYKFDLEEVELCVDEDIFKLIKKDIIAYNKKVDKIDFSKEKGVHIYVVYQGQKIGILLLDNWMEELEDEILETKDKLKIFMEKYEDKLFEKKQREEEELDRLKVEFEDFLLNDEEFLSCTNQKMRTYYMDKKIGDMEYSMYMKPFVTTDNIMGRPMVNRSVLWIFIESVWRKYKAIEKEQKQR